MDDGCLDDRLPECCRGRREARQEDMLRLGAVHRTRTFRTFAIEPSEKQWASGRVGAARDRLCFSGWSGGDFGEGLPYIPLELWLIDCEVEELPLGSHGEEDVARLHRLTWEHEECTAVPRGIGRLTGLHILELHGCWRHLGGDMTQLRDLHTLVLDGYRTLPQEVCGLSGLRVLRLAHCTDLERLPPAIGRLSGLHTLEVIRHGALVELPPEVCGLSGLRVLRLVECSGLKRLPPAIGRLSGLESLEVVNCWRLQEVPQEIGALRCLRILHLSVDSYIGYVRAQLLDDSGLETAGGGPSCPLQLPPLGGLAMLEELHLDGWRWLEGLPPKMAHLTALHTLSLRGYLRLVELPCGMPGLRTLDLSYCSWPEERLARLLRQTTGLQSLVLADWRHLPQLPPEVLHLRSLRVLNLYGCEHLRSLPPNVGTELTNLRKLFITNCSGLRALPWQLGHLQLDTFDCYGLAVPHSRFLEENMYNWPLVQRYLLDMRAAVPLRSHRVLLIGDGGAGKTTLARVLQLLVAKYADQNRPGLLQWVKQAFFLGSPTVDDEELKSGIDEILESGYESTHGVHLMTLQLPGHLFSGDENGGAEDVEVRVIDFAGQMEYLHTHWLFFTGVNSLYLVVAVLGDPKLGVGACEVALSSAKMWMGLLHSGSPQSAGTVQVASDDGNDCAGHVEVPLLAKVAGLVVTRENVCKVGEQLFEEWILDPISSALQKAQVPSLAHSCLLDYSDVATVKQCLDQVVHSALALEATVQYPAYCGMVLAAVQEVYTTWRERKKAEACCPLVEAREILQQCIDRGSTCVGEEQLEVALKILHSIGEVVLVEGPYSLSSHVVLEPLGWLSSTVALFVRREDNYQKCSSAVKERLVRWEDNPKSKGAIGERRRWGWIKRTRVVQELLLHNKKEDVEQIIEMLLRWRLCFVSGEHLVWPLRFTSTRWQQSRKKDVASVWTTEEALGHLLVGDKPAPRIQGMVLSSKGELLKIPPALFSMVVVELCTRHGYQLEEAMESFQEQVMMWRGQESALLTYSIEESCIRVVTSGPAAADSLLEMVVAFKTAQEHHFSIGWRYHLICGRCLVECRTMDSIVTEVELQTFVDGSDRRPYRWLLPSAKVLRCPEQRKTHVLSQACTVDEWLQQGFPVALSDDEKLFARLQQLLQEDSKRDAFLSLVKEESLEAVVSSHRTWMSLAAAEVVVCTFPAVVRLQVANGCYGSGFVATWRRRLYLITAGHVLKHLGKTNVETVTFCYSREGARSWPLCQMVEIQGLLKNDGLDVAVFPMKSLPQSVEPLELQEKGVGVTANEAVCIIQHPGGRPAKLDMGAKVTKVRGDRVYYALETDEGSSGAPVFSVRAGAAAVVAVHRSGEGGPGENEGTLMTSVMQWLAPLLPQ